MPSVEMRNISALGALRDRALHPKVVGFDISGQLAKIRTRWAISSILSASPAGADGFPVAGVPGFAD